MSASAELPVRDGQTVVFMGDSITDCACRVHHPPYGDGYVNLLVNLIRARHPQRDIAFHNVGVSGESTDELRQRWADDVIALKPDWLSMMVGINDCQRYLFDVGKPPVSPQRFAENYEVLLARTVEQTSARILLMDPFYVTTETDADERRGQVMQTLPKYIEVVHEMAERFDAVHIPLHELFMKHLRHRPPRALAGDAVHPTPLGHAILATAWLQAMQ